MDSFISHLLLGTLFCMLVAWVFIRLYPQLNWITFPSEEYKRELIMKPHVFRYISTITMSTYSQKVSSYSPRIPFMIQYMNHSIPVQDRYQSFVIRSVDTLYHRYLSAYIHVEDIQDTWNMMQSIIGLEMNMPFTLDDVIVIPSEKLRTYYEQPMLASTWIMTLLHEMIHVLQRKRPTAVLHWMKYRDGLSFIRMATPAEIIRIREWTQDDHMVNPDSNDWTVVYEINGMVVFPYLRIMPDDTMSLTESALDIRTGQKYRLSRVMASLEATPSRNLYLYEARQGRYGKTHLSWYHPYEIQACMLADDILKRRMEYREFIRELFLGV